MKVLDILTVFKDFLRAEDDFQQISSGITSYKGKHWFRAVQFRLNSRNVNSRDDQILYTLYYYQTLLWNIREDFKKSKRQRKWHCAKKGGVSEKYQIMNVLLKSDILLGEGGWSKPMSFFQNVFLLIICQFLSSSCYILSSIFSKIASFFPIFDTNSHFIIDCCVNGKV